MMSMERKRLDQYTWKRSHTSNPEQMVADLNRDGTTKKDPLKTLWTCPLILSYYTTSPSFQ